VANGELAKQYGGAIGRHRPHLGRKGKDLMLNRKGNIGKGNPKKRRNKRLHPSSSGENLVSRDGASNSLFLLVPMCVVCVFFIYLFYTFVFF